MCFYQIAIRRIIMFEIHTPKSWYSVFTYPEIIVDDDGLIYNSADYHKLLRNPIGKIDYTSGYIYGEDYCKLMPSPIGCIKRDGNVTMIFDGNYNRLNATPILYIKGNEIYSYDEYHKLFSTPSSYIKENTAKGSGNINFRAYNNSDNFVENKKSENSVVRKILAAFAMVFVSIAFVYGTMTEDVTYVPVFLAAIFAGFALTFLINKGTSDENAFVSICFNAFGAELGSVVVFWIGIMIIDLPGSHGFRTFSTIFLSPILIAVMMIIPSIVIGLIAYGIRKLFKK